MDGRMELKNKAQQSVGRHDDLPALMPIYNPVQKFCNVKAN
jgi:hypothetical protein